MADGPFDVIIVLGATQNPDGSAGPAMARRVRHAVRRHLEGRAACVMMAGGCTTQSIPESRTMADLAVSEGLDAGNVVEENRSTRTLENAIECRKIMNAKGWRKALLVTDGFHMPRALYTFRALGIDVTPDPNPVPLSFKSTLSVVRETVARMVYPHTVRRYLMEQR